MKKTLPSIACSLLLAVAAQAHELKHGHLHVKRDVAVVTNFVTEEINVVHDAQDVIVYIDKNDKSVSTKSHYRGQVHTVTSHKTSGSTSISTQAPPPPSPSPKKQEAPAQDKHVKKPNPPPKPKPVKQAPAPNPKPPPSNEQHHSGGTGFTEGVAYSPYNADNSCRSSSQVAGDLAKISGYDVIRLYGVDCNQVANVVSAIKGKGTRLFLGIFDINSIPSAVSTMKSGLGGDWSRVVAVSVGNELVNKGAASAGQVTGAIGTARSALKGAGYNGPVTTVDTMMAMNDHPELCEASDFCAINCHAFFDPNTQASGAGKFVSDWAKKISKAAGGKRTVVTESGWPHKGGSNGQAVAGPQQHEQAIASIKGAFSSDLILYTAFNDLWKQDSGDTHGCEKYWGMYGDA